YLEVIGCSLETRDGLSGFGFTYTIGPGGHAIKSLIDTTMRENLIGEESHQITHVWDRMWRATHSVGRGGISTHAMAAVDIALWDLKGKEVGKPLHWLLGGERRPIPLYDTNGGWVHLSVDELTRNVLYAV